MKKPVYLFQGDSITDCNRDRNNPDGLGDGYVSMLKERYPFMEIKNRGVSGDRVNELLVRWKSDVLELKPDVLSIYIGINDLWHHHVWGKPYTLASFEQMYQSLIDETRYHLPHVKLLLISPFALKMGHFQSSWQKDLDDIIKTVKSLSEKNKTLYLSLSDVFSQAENTYDKEDLTWDGVHPKPLGHAMIADHVSKILSMKT